MRFITSLILAGLLGVFAVAQDKQSEAPKAADKPIAAKPDTDKKLPLSVALTVEETNRIRVRQLRAEKLSAQLEKLQAQLKAEGDLLSADFAAILEKHGLTQEQARDYDVLNGESESEKPIILRQKPKPAPAASAPKP
jgi:hypothetical protein